VIFEPQLLLVGAVAAVGVLHTIAPDHWVPITLVARQRGWTGAETASASLKAGTGHVLSTLLIALIVWAAGFALPGAFGHYVHTVPSLALIGLGGWIAASSLLELRNRKPCGRETGYEMAIAEQPGAYGGRGGSKRVSTRTALLLILGSSPMVEGIPPFFAAGKYGMGLIVIMSLVLGIATVATYVVLCVCSTAGLQQISLGPLERYGEALSGVFIALMGVAFWVWPFL
jgi:hypothetical protein